MTKKTIKNKIEKEKNTGINFKSRVSAIYEISARNELHFSDVLPIYVWANYKIYSKYKKENENSRAYNPKLEEKVFRLTERIIDNNSYKRLKSLKEFEQI
jgi:hypothetical protein